MPSFMMNGKKMILDRGRWKTASNVGSKSSAKDIEANKQFAARVRAEQAKTIPGVAKAINKNFTTKVVEPIKAVVKANVNLAKEKGVQKLQKAGVGGLAYKTQKNNASKELGAKLARAMVGGALTGADIKRGQAMAKSSPEKAKKILEEIKKKNLKK